MIGLAGPCQRSAQVVVVDAEALHPEGRPLGVTESAPGLVGEGREGIPVTEPNGRHRTPGVELLVGVLADRFEEAVARPACTLLGHDERCVDQSADQVDGKPLVAVEADGCGRRHAEAAGEHREPIEQGPFIVRQQIVAPVHGCAECPVPGS